MIDLILLRVAKEKNEKMNTMNPVLSTTSIMRMKRRKKKRMTIGKKKGPRKY